MIALNRLICANRMLELIYVSAPDAGEHSAFRYLYPRSNFRLKRAAALAEWRQLLSA